MNKLIFLLITLFISSGLAYGISDSNPSNNVMNANVEIVETGSFTIVYKPVDMDTTDDFSNFNQRVNEMTDYLKSLYPIADDGVSKTTGSSYQSGPIERKFPSRVRDNILKGEILSKDLDRVVGIVPPSWFAKNAFNPLLKKASGLADDKSVLAEGIGFRQLAAHELGHTYGLCDEYDSLAWALQDGLFQERCPNGDDSNPGRELDTDCKPQGCPVSTLGIVVPWDSSEEPISLYNLMGSSSYTNSWISTESYNQLLDVFKNKKFDKKASSTLIIAGFINKTTDTIELLESYEVGERTLSTKNNTISGNYSIELKDFSNNTISYLNFSPSFLEIGFNGSTVETNESYFLFVLNNSNISKIIVKHNDTIKDQEIRSANTPSVNITSPLDFQTATTKFNLTWNATDADGDDIVYAILMSTDNGGNYSTLAVDLNQTYYEIDPEDMDYSTEYAFKILATDGFNTGSDAIYNITSGNPLRITYLSETFSDELDKTIRFIFENQVELNLTDINWIIDYGDGINEQNFESISLQPYQYEIVDLNHTCEKVGNVTIEVNVFNSNFSYSKIINITVNDTSPSNPLIIYPNGGETITESPLEINWTQSYDNQSVLYYLDYSDNSGSRWYSIIANYGLEDRFNDSSDEINLSYEQPENKTFNIKIPKNSIITNAYFKISATK